MDAAEWIVTVFMALAGLTMFLSVGLTGGYLERRASSTQAEVLDDLTRYGPHALGLRVDLLPEPTRSEVMAMRREREGRRLIRHRAKQTGGLPPVE